jgi:hypothetical protein
VQLLTGLFCRNLTQYSSFDWSLPALHYSRTNSERGHHSCRMGGSLGCHRDWSCHGPRHPYNGPVFYLLVSHHSTSPYGSFTFLVKDGCLKGGLCSRGPRAVANYRGSRGLDSVCDNAWPSGLSMMVGVTMSLLRATSTKAK